MIFSKLDRSRWQWNGYGDVFASLVTNPQRELLSRTAQYMHGDMLDACCGSAKLAPLVRPVVRTYTGLDQSRRMLYHAKNVVKMIPDSGIRYKIMRGDILSPPGFSQSFSAVACLNALYAIGEPELVLKNLRTCMTEGGTLVLATPNRSFNITKLLEEERRWYLGNKAWQVFADYNATLASNARLFDMETLLNILHATGFGIRQCSDDLYGGGLNFIVAYKK